MGFFDKVMGKIGFISVREASQMHSERLPKLIIELEGKSNDSYRDAVGLWTIGVGHLITSQDPHLYKLGIKEYDKRKLHLTDEQCLALLKLDMDMFEEGVRKLITVEVKDHEFDALLSLAFNVGLQNFKLSTLLRLLNTKEYKTKTALAKQFLRWKYAGGQALPGLMIRRVIEVCIFLNHKYPPEWLIQEIPYKYKDRVRKVLNIYYER